MNEGLGCFLFNRPLPSTLLRVARQTLTDADILPPRHAEAKTSIPLRYDQRLCLKGMTLLPGQVAHAKILYCLRIVCAGLRRKYLFLIATNGDQQLTILNDSNSFGDDPIMKTSFVSFFFLLVLIVPAIASAEDPDTAIQCLLDYVRHSD